MANQERLVKLKVDQTDLLFAFHHVLCQNSRHWASSFTRIITDGSFSLKVQLKFAVEVRLINRAQVSFAAAALTPVTTSFLALNRQNIRRSSRICKHFALKLI